MDSVTINVTSDTTDDAISSSIADYVEQGSKPFNYHPTEEEVEIARKRLKLRPRHKQKRMQSRRKNKKPLTKQSVKLPKKRRKTIGRN